MRATGWTAVAALLLLLPSGSRAERPKLTPALVAEGRQAFLLRCAGCHGDGGRGDGEQAQVLPTLPRDFALEDLRGGRDVTQVYATVAAGVAGSSMPAFSELPERERWGICYRVLILRAAGRRARLAAKAAQAADLPEPEPTVGRGP